MFLSGAVPLPRRGSHQDQKKSALMIQLTRLNNKPLTVNSDLIKFIEQSPDTLVTLITGEKIVVLEKAQEVLTRIIDFRRAVLQGLCFPWDTSAAPAMIARSPEHHTHEPEK